MNRVLVVAEPGAMHGGSLDKMRELIRMAAACEADAIKFQWVSSPERLCERRRAPEYLDAYRMIAFPEAWHKILQKDCETTGLLFGCTGYLHEDVIDLSLYVDFHKIASFEASDRTFLDAHVCTNRPLWISTGMMNREEVVGVAEWMIKNRTMDGVLLHCVSAYPCPMDQACLSAIRSLYGFGINVGFSDHTGFVLSGALAVAAGADAVEVHVRLDDADPNNPDYPHALSPEKFREYVQNIRLAEQAMGDGRKRCMPCEEPMRRFRVGG